MFNRVRHTVVSFSVSRFCHNAPQRRLCSTTATTQQTPTTAVAGAMPIVPLLLAASLPNSDSLEFNTRQWAASVIRQLADDEKRRGGVQDVLEYNTRQDHDASSASSLCTTSGTTINKQKTTAAWVCRMCGAPHTAASRTVCPICFTKRQLTDQSGGDAALCTDHPASRDVTAAISTTWRCSRCTEVNQQSDVYAAIQSCRCCGIARQRRYGGKLPETALSSSSLGGPSGSWVPILLQDPRQSIAIGDPFRASDLLLRWRCSNCSSTSSQMTRSCQRCGEDRFTQHTIRCPTCKSISGQTAEDVVERRPCLNCGSPLHGALIASVASTWVCTCGMLNAMPTCFRCRAPCRIPVTHSTSMRTSHTHSMPGEGPAAAQQQQSQQYVRELHWIRSYDFRCCTQWSCARCSNINEASRKVYISRVPSTGRILSELVSGQHSCSRCEEPWHGLKLDGGRQWRCACHHVNSTKRDLCALCTRPQTLQSVNVHSVWMVGDWVCGNCGKHSYRDKSVCICGARKAEAVCE